VLDDSVVRRAAARERCKRQLALAVPVDQVQPRGAHGLLDADEPGEQEQRKVEPRRPAAAHDDTLRIAGDDEGTIRVDAHGWIPCAHRLAVAPVRRGVLTVPQPRFRNQ